MYTIHCTRVPRNRPFRSQDAALGGWDMQEGMLTEPSILVQLPAVALSWTTLFQDKVEHEIEGRPGGIDRAVADG